MEKPKNVAIAVNLQWASLALGVFFTLFSLIKRYSELTKYTSTPYMVAFLLILTVALSSFFIVNAAGGKNWARVMLALSFATGIFQIPGLFTSAVRCAIFGLQYILQGYSVFLLFAKSGSAWFSKLKEPVS